MPPSDSLDAANAALQSGIEAMTSGDMDLACRCFEDSLGHVPNNHIALKNLAAIAAKRGQLADAEAYFDGVGPADETADMLFDLAKICEALEKFDRSREAFGKAVARQDSTSKMKRAFAKFELRVGEREKAVQLYRELVDSDPSDTNAVLAYAKLIWTYAPGEAMACLAKLLEKVTDPNDRIEILFNLILYKESAGRSGRGQEKYHASSVSDGRVQFSNDELDALIEASSDVLADDETSASGLLGNACAYHAKGERQVCQEYFMRLKEAQPKHVGSTVSLDDAFLSELSQQTINDIASGLPPVDWVKSLETGDKPVIFVSSDYPYFYHFGRYFVASINRHMPGACIQVHLMDAAPEQVADAVDWCNRNSSVTCAISNEMTGLGPAQSEEAACYYHAIRFVRFVQLRERYAGPLWLFDADVLAHRDALPVLESGDGWDVAYRLRPGRLEPWNVINASLVGMAPTEAGLSFFRVAAAYLAHFWRENQLAWGIDQLALLAAFYATDNPRIRFLNAREQDIEMHEDGYFWFMSGPNKHALLNMENGKSSVLLGLRPSDQRFADAYLSYLP